MFAAIGAKAGTDAVPAVSEFEKAIERVFRIWKLSRGKQQDELERWVGRLIIRRR